MLQTNNINVVDKDFDCGKVSLLNFKERVMHTDNKGYRLPTAPQSWPFGRVAQATKPETQTDVLARPLKELPEEAPF